MCRKLFGVLQKSCSIPLVLPVTWEQSKVKLRGDLLRKLMKSEEEEKE